MQQFDIVIPAYKNPGELSKTLNSLRDERELIAAIYICIDGSRSPFAHLIDSDQFSDLPCFWLNHPGEQHKGRQATRNLGIHQSTSKFVLFLDSDIVKGSGNTLKILAERLASYSIVRGNLHITNASTHHWANYYQWRLDSFKDVETLPVEKYVSQCVAFTRNVFDTAGVMPEEILTYGGDLGYALQLKTSGFDVIGYCGNAHFFAEELKSLDTVVDQHYDLGSVTLKQLKSIFSMQEESIYRQRIIFSLAHLLPVSSEVLLHCIKTTLIPLICNLEPGQLSRSLIRFLIFLTMLAGVKDD